MVPQLLLFAACLAIATATSPMVFMIPKEIHMARRACMSELGIEMPKERPSEPLDPAFKCLQKCVLEKLEYIRADGTLNEDAIRPGLKEVGKQCFTEVKDVTDACDRAHDFVRCVFKSMGQGMKDISDECAKETETEVILSEGPKGKRCALEAMMEDETKACYIRCLFIKMNKLDQDDGIIVDSVAMHFPEGSDVQMIVDTCSKENDQANKCVKATQRGACVLKQIRQGFKQ